MIVIILFWSLVLCCCSYAVVAGGSDGRAASMMIVLASLLTIPASLLYGWRDTQYAVSIIDTVLLAAMYALALHSRSHWPMWLASFQVITVATHLATLLVPEFTPRLYRGLAGMWAIPGLMAMAYGIFRDRKAGLGDLRRP